MSEKWWDGSLSAFRRSLDGLTFACLRIKKETATIFDPPGDGRNGIRGKRDESCLEAASFLLTDPTGVSSRISRTFRVRMRGRRVRRALRIKKVSHLFSATSARFTSCANFSSSSTTSRRTCL